MLHKLSGCVVLAVSITSTLAAPVDIDFQSLANNVAQVISSYAPVSNASCPATPLVRAADGISVNETNYRTERKKVADVALKSWLTKTNAAFATDGNMPTIALSTSGGGYRSLLVGSGVIQGMDIRDSNSSVAGLYQALTYHTGLSGGSWMISSMAGNNYPTVTSLKENLWKQMFAMSLLDPKFLLASGATYASISMDLMAKDMAGFTPTLTDPWGRLLSQQFLPGPDGSAGMTLSSITKMSNFTQFNVPYPIITSLGVKEFNNEFVPGPNATTYEFTPYEFGSWDKDVSAFTQMAFLGTKLDNGKPASATACTTNFDNLGLVLGTSSTLFNLAAKSLPDPMNSTSNFLADLSEILTSTHVVSMKDVFGSYPNPFLNYQSATQVPNSANLISKQANLSLVDGGEALQNNPIFPMLQPSRAIDVLLVNDNSADSAQNFPNGSEILTTYVQSVSANLTRMPYIPSVDTFAAQGLATRPTFFGCNDPSKLTIIYIPNKIFNFASNVSTAMLEFKPEETDGIISNGAQIASNGNDPMWATCLGCGIMAKSGAAMPPACPACLNQYCYKGTA